MRLAARVASRFFLAQVKPKRMVIMCGPPAAGKGVFTGEPEPKANESRFGWKFPDSTHGLFTSKDIPERPEYDESDNHLRTVQFDESEKHYDALATAHKEGLQAFKKALKDHWYETKDGNRVELGSVVSYEDFPDSHEAFFKKAERDFYVSMRGWHDDAKTPNRETGKPTERFKDEARHRFDDSVNEKIDRDNELLIVDSAGEDIDAQDFRGQIEKAKANGYEVTVVFLHPEQADTELSNIRRGRVAGKRMVDQADISNWYKQNAAALKEIQEASPDNFLHYRKPPPDPDPAKAAEMRKKARELMMALPPPPVPQKGEDKKAFDARKGAWQQENKEALETIDHIIYKAASYPKEPDAKTSWGTTLNKAKIKELGMTSKPPGDIAKTVAEMNSEAEGRAGKAKEAPGKPSKKPEEEKPGKPRGEAEEEPAKGGGTKQDFLKAMRGKKVPNPNPDTRKKNPQVLVTGLPWKFQKPLYEKWVQSQQRAASLTQNVATRYAMETKKPFSERLMRAIAKDIQKGFRIDGYEYEIILKKGPVLFVSVKGAEGDLSMVKEARPHLEEIVKKTLKQETAKYDGFDLKLTSVNKGDDLMFEVEVLFP